MNQNVMQTTIIKMAETSDEIRACYPVMRQLRPHFTDEKLFIEQVQRQLNQGYLLAHIEEEAQIKAVIGFRFLEFLAWGKVLYIDDLITDSTSRSQGHGSTLLTWTIELAKKKGCDQVHLDSGPQRHDAHRLYLNHRLKIIAHHFALDFKS